MALVRPMTQLENNINKKLDKTNSKEVLLLLRASSRISSSML